MELVLLVCLMSNPKNCHEENMAFETAQQCIVNAPPAMAEWKQGNPKFFIASFTCRPIGKDA